MNMKFILGDGKLVVDMSYTSIKWEFKLISRFHKLINTIPQAIINPTPQ